MTSTIHRSKVGTYHPQPYTEGTCDCSIEDCGGAQWTINDTRGTIDGGPACDECGACECMGPCAEGCINPAMHITDCDTHGPDRGCIGLSFAYVCLDGGETLCEACAEKAGIEIVECDCA